MIGISFTFCATRVTLRTAKSIEGAEIMKIKLNVSKDFKRDLKIVAEKQEMERKAFTEKIITDYVVAHEADWAEDIDGLLEAIKEGEESPEEIAKTKMKKTTKKLQPIIASFDEKTYCCISLLAGKGNTSIEQLCEDVLKAAVKANK